MVWPRAVQRKTPGMYMKTHNFPTCSIGSDGRHQLRSTFAELLSSLKRQTSAHDATASLQPEGPIIASGCRPSIGSSWILSRSILEFFGHQLGWRAIRSWTYDSVVYNQLSSKLGCVNDNLTNIQCCYIKRIVMISWSDILALPQLLDVGLYYDRGKRRALNNCSWNQPCTALSPMFRYTDLHILCSLIKRELYITIFNVVANLVCILIVGLGPKRAAHKLIIQLWCSLLHKRHVTNFNWFWISEKTRA